MKLYKGKGTEQRFDFYFEFSNSTVTVTLKNMFLQKTSNLQWNLFRYISRTHLSKLALINFLSQVSRK